MAVSKLKFDRMIRRAKEGDEKAEQELKQYIRSHAQYANRNLAELEQADLTDYAYARAMKYLNTDEGVQRFRGATAGTSITQLIARAEEMHTFLRSTTHTVYGAQSAWESQKSGLMALNEAGYIHIPTDRETIKRISKALGNDGLKFTQAERYDIMDKLGMALEQRAKQRAEEGNENLADLSDSELKTIAMRYATGERIYNDLVEGIL